MGEDKQEAQRIFIGDYLDEWINEEVVFGWMNARADGLTRSSFPSRVALPGVHREIEKSIHKRRNISRKTAVKYCFQLRKIYREKKQREIKKKRRTAD